MAGDIIDREYLDINGIDFEVETLNMDPEKNSSIVESMTRNKHPLGVTSGNQHWVITADIVLKISQLSDMDSLDDLYKNDTEVPITVLQEGGNAISFQSGFITGLSETSSNGEAAKRSVTVTAWGRSTV